MERNLSKSRLALMLAALFLSTCCTMGDMAVVPIFANLFEVFPNVALVNFMISGPGLVGLVFCLLGGRLADKMDKKTLLVVGFAIFTASGLLGAAVVNDVYVAAMRCLCTGVAWGLTSTAAVGIIAEYYVDEAKRGKIVGWYNAAMAAMGAALSFVGGLLGVHGWRVAFNAYWIGVPVLLMLIFFVPACPAHKDAEASEKAKGSRGWASKLIPLLAGFFLTAICYYVIVYMISLFVADSGLGNEAFSGTLSSIGTITSCLMGMAFGVVYAKLKKRTSLPSYVLLALGFLLMFLFPGKVMAIVACAFMGAAWGNVYSYYYTECTVVVPENMQGTSLGIVGIVNGLASFLVTYFVTLLEKILHVDNIRSVFPVFVVILAVVAVAAFFYKMAEARHAAA